MELQRQLREAKYDIGNTGANRDGVDGVWGSKTQAAYEAWSAAQKPQQTTTTTTQTPTY